MGSHLEATVTVDADDQTIGERDLRADGRRQTIAHRAKAAGREPRTGLGELVELGSPPLVLAHTSGNDGVAWGEFVNGFDHILALDDLFPLFVVQRVCLSPTLDHL